MKSWYRPGNWFSFHYHEKRPYIDELFSAKFQCRKYLLCHQVFSVDCRFRIWTWNTMRNINITTYLGNNRKTDFSGACNLHNGLKIRKKCNLGKQLCLLQRQKSTVFKEKFLTEWHLKKLADWRFFFSKSIDFSFWGQLWNYLYTIFVAIFFQF